MQQSSWAAATFTPNGDFNSLFQVIDGQVGTAMLGSGWTPSGADWVAIRLAFDTVPHELTLGRNGGGAGLPCQLLSGIQTVVVDFVDAPITASSTNVPVGQSVHVTATPNFTPSPLSQTEWVFYPDTGGGSVVTACSGVLVCDYAPPTSGRMSVIVFTVGGAVQTFSPRVFVLKCPTGDSILDDPKVREGLLLALKLSHSDTTPTSARREQGGYIYRDSSTGKLNYKITTNGGDACNIDYTADLAHTIYLFHTHPFSPPDGFFSSAERMPTTHCIGMKAGSIYDDKAWGGFSPEDWLSSINSHKPSIVFDRKRFYLSNPTVTDSTQWADSAKRYDWNTKACKWI